MEKLGSASEEHGDDGRWHGSDWLSSGIEMDCIGMARKCTGEAMTSAVATRTAVEVRSNDRQRQGLAVHRRALRGYGIAERGRALISKGKERQ